MSGYKLSLIIVILFNIWTALHSQSSWGAQTNDIQRLYELPVSYDQWGNPSSNVVRIKIILKFIEADDGKGKIILQIIPHNWDIPLALPETFYIHDFEMFLVSENNYFQLMDAPLYRAVRNSQLIKEELSSLPPGKQKTYKVAGQLTKISLKLLMAKLGIDWIWDLSETTGKTMDAISKEDKDFKHSWNTVYKYDTYPIPYPRGVSPSGAYRLMEIELPYRLYKGSMTGFLYIKKLVIGNNNLSSPTFTSLSNEKIILSQNKLIRQVFVEPIHRKMAAQVKINNSDHLKIKFEEVVSQDSKGGYWELICKPEFMGKLHNIKINWQVRKGNIRLTGMPEFLNYMGEKERHVNQKNKSSFYTMASWIALLSGKIFKIWDTAKDSFDLYKIFMTEEISFHETLQKIWEIERDWDMYELPEYANKPENLIAGEEGFRLRIPVEIYGDNVSENIVHFTSNITFRDDKGQENVKSFYCRIVLDDTNRDNYPSVGVLVINSQILNSYDQGFISVCNQLFQSVIIGVDEIISGSKSLTDYKVVVCNIFGTPNTMSDFDNQAVRNDVLTAYKQGTNFVLSTSGSKILEIIELGQTSVNSGWYPALKDSYYIYQINQDNQITENLSIFPEIYNFSVSELDAMEHDALVWRVDNRYNYFNVVQLNYRTINPDQYLIQMASTGWSLSQPYNQMPYWNNGKSQILYIQTSFWTEENSTFVKGYIGVAGKTVLQNAVNYFSGEM